ncbi:hypothetical protein BRD56_03545 [Thermoplasmatales archaeon SW_10_69_26]|nr:MAG: hypothetical protein BRD56_03545 [Thermoplasmatales archaeon SW_10_69_26]
MQVPRLAVVVLALVTAVPAAGQALAGTVDAPDGPSIPAAGSGSADVLEDGLAASDPANVIVHARDDEALDRATALDGIEPRYRFAHLDAAYALAREGSLATLAEQPGITFVEDADKRLEYHLDEATITSRAREVFDPSFDPSPFVDEPTATFTADDGSPIDGDGVGIAVVDSGLDATHPTFDAPGKVPANYVVTPAAVVDVGSYSELGEGHGTRIAGVAAGTGGGTAGDADLRGAAPGASLYGFAVEPRNQRGYAGTFSAEKPATTLEAAIAFDWILENGDQLDPAIDVVLNGWTCDERECGDERQAHLQLAQALADDGHVVVFPVGNGHGEALVPATSAEATLPTPGVLGVAGYDDEGPGDRDSCASKISSQGNAFDPSTWPDIAGPSNAITSPNALSVQQQPRLPAGSGQDPTSARYGYTDAFGTSIGAAHIAGVAALMLQANPELTPGEVEHVLESTAHEGPELADGGHCPAPFLQADATNPWDGANYEVGHGLVDAVDALEAAIAFDGLPDTEPSLAEIPDDYLHEDAVVSPDEDQAFHLEGEDELSREAPEGDLPRVRARTWGESIVHRTEIQQETTISAAYAEIWIGDGDQSTQHTVFCRSVNFQAEIARIDADTGEREVIGVGETDAEPMAGPGPWMKEIPVVFGDKQVSADDPVHEPREVTFEPGDELEVGVRTSDYCTFPDTPHPEGEYVVYSEAESTPSRIFLGESTTEYRPGSFEACQEIRDNYADAVPEEDIECSWIGGARQNVPIECREGRYKVEWFGPPGSGAAVKCTGADAACTIPQDADGWQTCEAEAIAHTANVATDLCTYFTPDGEQVDGEGRCTIVREPTTRPS